jgi:RND family efflux transporter MFP subunit
LNFANAKRFGFCYTKFMKFFHRLWRYLLSLPRLYSIGGAIIFVVVALVVVHAATRSSSPAAAEAFAHVTVASVGSLTSTSGPLPVSGKVTSLNRATILAQSSGEIVSLNTAIGARVGAGAVLAQFENSAQQAAVLQAQGVYESAQAALAKATGSTAANAGISSGQASQTAANAATVAISSIQSAYSALDDAVHAKADSMFSNPRTISPTFNLTVPDSQLTITLQNERSELEGLLAHAKTLSTNVTADKIDANATALSEDAQKVITFLNNLVQAANEAQTSQNVSATALATFQASAGAARGEVVAAVSALASAKSSYDSATASAQSASNSATIGSQNDIAAAQANLKQALGALNSAKAALEKTIVRSPISGTVVSLAVTRGDFVSAFTQVADISNPGALEVVTNVTPSDAKTLTVGGKATIGDGVTGVITSIAPALDPTTGKIQVKVGITGSQSKLTDGDTTTVLLERGDGKASATAPATIRIPIIAAKITPTGPVVFTVSSSTLEAHSIVFGPIVGEQVEVSEGLTIDMAIVSDARGLSNGQKVVVDED